MTTLFIAMKDALLVIRRHSGWEAQVALSGKSYRCVAADPRLPARAYCGTADSGVWRSDDGGDSWRPVGDGIRHPHVTAVAISPGPSGFGSSGSPGWPSRGSGDVPESHGDHRRDHGCSWPYAMMRIGSILDFERGTDSKEESWH